MRLMTFRAGVQGWTWAFVVLASLGVAVFSLRYFVAPGQAPLLVGREGVARASLLVHAAGGIAALAAGPFQFSARLRRWSVRWHRGLGFVYLAGVTVGGLAGLVSAQFTIGGLTARFAFSLLALVWLACTALAWRAVCRRDLAAHREWMLRSFALTFAAVTLRLWLVLLQAGGAAFMEAYQTVAWLCWVPNLIAAEVWIAATRGASAGQPALGPRPAA
ncbi:MAG: DUF2306 domain-containing protein [Limisphaerales bacterium]